MTNRVEIFAGIIDKVSKPGFDAGAAAAIHDQFRTDKNGFSLIVQGAQSGSAIASVISITQLTTGAVPFINVATNTLAGTVTFLKIVAEYKTTKKFNEGDIISLVGNVAGLVAGFALLAGAPITATAFTAVAVGAAFYGTVNSEMVKYAHDKVVVPIVKNLHNHNFLTEKSLRVFSPNLSLAPPSEIRQKHGGLVAALLWNPKTSQISINAKKIQELGLNDGAIKTALYGGSIIPPEPARRPKPSGNDTVTMSIETLNDKRPPGPTPTITTKFPSLQDSYACCAAPQQDKYH